MRVAGIIIVCVLLFESGCIGNNAEVEVVSATDPNLPVGISAFELAPAAVKVTADPDGFGIFDSSGRRVETILVNKGDTFSAGGFNRGEDWELVGFPQGHALFRVQGTQAGCVGVWPFGPPVHRFAKTVIVCPHGRELSGP